MSPALAPDDRILAFRGWPLRRGALIFFRHPDRPDFWLVKRVVAVAGEHVAIVGGEVAVDGDTRLDRWGSGPTHPELESRVPDGHVFVLSDARTRSRADSRRFGPVPVAGAYRGGLRYRRGRR